MIESYLKKNNKEDIYLLKDACIHCSYREQIATKAERDTIKYMQVKFMEKKNRKKVQGNNIRSIRKGIIC